MSAAALTITASQPLKRVLMNRLSNAIRDTRWGGSILNGRRGQLGDATSHDRYTLKAGCFSLLSPGC